MDIVGVFVSFVDFNMGLSGLKVFSSGVMGVT